MKKIDKLLNRKLNRQFLSDFYKSDFCKKRGINCDIKLKEFNQISVTKCLKDYKKIVDRNVELLDTYIKEYYSKSKLSHCKAGERDRHSFGVMLYKALYLDPDSYDVRHIGKDDTICKADALFSLNRIIYFQNDELNINVVNDYKLLRNKSIFYFPPKTHINPKRYSYFNDKIDYFLYDLKNFLEGKKCRMEKVYKMKATKKWLESFDNSFSEFVLWFRIDNKFVKKVNGEYKVINIENNTIINDYPDNYSWSRKYYDNLKKIVQKSSEI